MGFEQRKLRRERRTDRRSSVKSDTIQGSAGASQYKKSEVQKPIIDHFLMYSDVRKFILDETNTKPAPNEDTTAAYGTHYKDYEVYDDYVSKHGDKVMGYIAREYPTELGDQMENDKKYNIKIPRRVIDQTVRSIEAW